ncbi:MAG: hypothetical protein NBV67_17780 [Tagaea sp.]|nr:hypothetical protein [Tagaea sp.]
MYCEIRSTQDEVRPQARRAVVTLALGATYLNRWQAVVRARFEAYAAAQGYDAILISAPLDRSWRALKRSPAWQKCLILSQPWSAAYDRIGWIDADCVPRPDAPDLFGGVPPDKVGATFVQGQLDETQIAARVMREFAISVEPESAHAAHAAIQAEVYRTDGFADPPLEMMHTGVLALSPAHHRDLLESAYARESQNRWYEQTALSNLTLKAGAMIPIDPRFNWLLDAALPLDWPGTAGEAVAAHLAGGDRDFAGYLAGHWRRAWFLHLGETVWRALGTQEAAALDRLLAA